MQSTPELFIVVIIKTSKGSIGVFYF